MHWKLFIFLKDYLFIFLRVIFVLNRACLVAKIFAYFTPVPIIEISINRKKIKKKKTFTGWQIGQLSWESWHKTIFFAICLLLQWIRIFVTNKTKLLLQYSAEKSANKVSISNLFNSNVLPVLNVFCALFLKTKMFTVIFNLKL